MSNYNISIDLMKLENAGLMNAQGPNGVVKGIFIPIEENKISESNGKAWLSLTAIESTNNEYGNSHFLKRQNTKEEREQYRATGERTQLPILGNMKVVDYGNGGNNPTYSQVAENTTAQAAPTPTAQAPAPKPAPATQSYADDDSDLPF